MQDFAIVDQSARSPALSMYVFASTAETPVKVSGFFTNLDGRQVSSLYIFQVGAEPVSLRTGIGGAFPPDAYGFVGRLSGEIYVGTGADMKTGEVPDAYRPGPDYPSMLATNLLAIGRVSG